MIRLIDFAAAQPIGVEVRVDAQTLEVTDDAFQSIAAMALRMGGGPGFRAHRATWDSSGCICRSLCVMRLPVAEAA